KIEIAKAVEKLFGVRVDKVNTQWVRGKMKRVGRNIGKRPNWKKAVVTLRDGDTIDLFEGA
ncbi:MAG: large subunit ribosomal protein L23, partial [Myxococcota bacterium]